jgi:hypothetical protein
LSDLNLDRKLDVGLPEHFDINLGWWIDREELLASLMDQERLNQLSYELVLQDKQTKAQLVKTDITENEALIILQAEKLNFIGGISRLDSFNPYRLQHEIRF